MATDKILRKVDQHEKEIIKEAERIEEAQERIEKEEKEILTSEKRIFSYLRNHSFLSFFIEPGLTKRELKFFRLTLVNKITKHKLIYVLILTFAFVLIWKGFWDFVDTIPFLSNWFVSIVAGLLIIWFLRRYTDCLYNFTHLELEEI